MSGPTSREESIAQLVFGPALNNGPSYKESLEELQDRIKGILSVYDNIDQTIFGRVDAQLGIQLKEKTENGEDYILKVHRPDGTVIQILIPVEGEYDDCLSEGGKFGLNLLTEGHYA